MAMSTCKGSKQGKKAILYQQLEKLDIALKTVPLKEKEQLYNQPWFYIPGCGE